MDYIKQKLALVPNKPGCYQMKNKDGIIIYVGKAKKLKNRLSSYFRGTHTGKTKKLVSEISDFEYIVVENETESLVLELNLIKKYGWYKAKNHGNNLNGISRDHMLSIADGFKNSIDPKHAQLQEPTTQIMTPTNIESNKSSNSMPNVLIDIYHNDQKGYDAKHDSGN